MPIEINTKVSTGDTYNKKVGNLILEDAKFFGRPNFSGELDRFKDDRRKFTVLIPNELADQLREMGWNVKTSIPTEEERAEGREELSHLKVMVDMSDEPGRGPDVWVIMGEDREKLTTATVGILDRSRIDTMDMEIRAWEYDPEENPGKYSARLVMLVAHITPNRLEEKYGRLR
jgi:hypothetical protein